MKAHHKTPQNATGSTVRPRALSVEQLNAVGFLVSGMSDVEVASMVGVARETVWSWRNEAPVFMAELEKARQAFIAQAVDTLRSALPKAVSNLVAAVDAGDLKASLALLRCVGLYGAGAQFKPGETDADAIATRLCLEGMILGDAQGAATDDALLAPL